MLLALSMRAAGADRELVCAAALCASFVPPVALADLRWPHGVQGIVVAFQLAG